MMESPYLDPEEEKRKQEEALRQQRMQAEQMRQNQQKAGQLAGKALQNVPYAAPAAAMAALIYGGEKAGVGVEAQAKEYKRFGKKLDDEVFDRLKFWEWFS